MSGVPQGSILGPLLLLIYINDLHSCLKYSKIYHFADDTNITLSDSSQETLAKRMNHNLRKLSMCLRPNELYLNVEKTEFVLFQRQNTKLNNLKKLYGPFLGMGFNCLKARGTSRRQFTFYHYVPRNSWYSFYQPLLLTLLLRSN